MNVSNVLPILMSLVALMFSGYSLYEATLRAPSLSVHVAPRGDYTHPGRSDDVREVFVLPITLANAGARPSTVLSINLEVTNPRTKAVKRYYAARTGTWGEAPVRPFAPVVLTGRSTYTQTLQFEPRRGETVPRITDMKAGTYDLKLTLDTAAASEPGAVLDGRAPPLQFQMQLDDIDYRYFDRTGTMELWTPGYQSPSSTPR